MERLTIDEAIALVKIERECVIRADVCDRKCEKCDLLQDSTELIDMYKQIAEWLRELKDYREKNKMVVRIDVENMDSIKDKIEEYAESQYNKAIDECNKKLDELERNYKSCYGTEIIEMYADVYEDFRAWLKEQNK